VKLSRRRAVPFVAQTEISECAIACIAMITNYYGSSESLAALRERYPQSQQGMTLTRIIRIVGELGFHSRPVQVDLGALQRLQLPAILHWNLSHFVVIVKATRRRVVIHDPAVGRLRMSYGDVSRSFTGVALELAPGTRFEPSRSGSHLSIRSLTGAIVGLKRSLAGVLTLALALEATTLLAPLASQIIFDQALPTGDRDLLLAAAIGFAALLVLQSCLSAMRSWILIVLGANTAFAWSRNVFAHLLKLPTSYFYNRNLGDIMSRLDSVTNIQRTLTNWSVEAILDGVTACITAVALVLYSPTLSIIPFSAFALYAILRVSSYNSLQLTQLNNINAVARLQSFLVESIRGVQTVKLQNATESRSSQFANVAFRGAQTRIAVDRMNMAFSVASSLIVGLQRLLVLCLGAKLILDGRLTVGALMVFLLYSGQLGERGARLLDYLVELRMLRLQAQRLADIALTAPERNTTGTLCAATPVPSIEMRHVSFRYSPSERDIVKDCSFRIAPGEAVAIVGPSGCGKTTLAKLLLGLLEPQSGQILIGGLQVGELGKNALRSLAATVLEDDQVFMGSIEDNIHFFQPLADHARVVQAATAAEMHSDVLSFPMGYRTLVGDLGSTLSAGQKQRLLLARALYRNPRILILDEATCHLDVKNERLVCNALRRSSLTRVMIAHRPEAITMADWVLEMDSDGSVRAQKTAIEDIAREPAARVSGAT
jgi:ATP-binding cassette subfamily B protein RaxB